MDRSEVARLMAEALGLSDKRCADPELPGAWWGPQDGFVLFKDGSNIYYDYWRCRCEDWLFAHGWCFTACKQPFAVRQESGHSPESIQLDCSWPEAPARLVAAVWQRMWRKPHRAN